MGARTETRPSDTDRVLLDILEVVADARNEEATDLTPINQFFDPTALERFLDSSTVSTTVTFDVYGCRVTVDDDGQVAVTDGPDGS